MFDDNSKHKQKNTGGSCWQRGEVTSVLVLLGVAVMVVGIVAGKKLVEIGTNFLPKAQENMDLDLARGAGPGTYQENYQGITYDPSSAWERVTNNSASGNYFKRSDTRSSTATFKVNGDDLDLFLRRSGSAGKAGIYIDGDLKRIIDLYKNSNPDFERYSFNLTSGIQRVKIEVRQNKNDASTNYNVGLDYFVVRVNPTPTPTLTMTSTPTVTVTPTPLLPDLTVESISRDSQTRIWYVKFCNRGLANNTGYFNIEGLIAKVGDGNTTAIIARKSVPSVNVCYFWIPSCLSAMSDSSFCTDEVNAVFTVDTSSEIEELNESNNFMTQTFPAVITPTPTLTPEITLTPAPLACTTWPTAQCSQRYPGYWYLAANCNPATGDPVWSGEDTDGSTCPANPNSDSYCRDTAGDDGYGCLPSPTPTVTLTPTPTVTLTPILTLTPTPTGSITPSVTITPSPTPICPDGDLGNLNCDAGRLINATDLSILLSKWCTVGCSIIPTPNPGQHSADITEDGYVNATDLLKLLQNWVSNW